MKAHPLGKIVIVVLLLAGLSPLWDQATANGETRVNEAEIQKLMAEKNKLDAEAKSLRLAPWTGLGIGLFAIGLPLWLGVFQLKAQRIAQADRARVDAILKAAEIAMNAPTTGQVRSRSELLRNLLGTLTPDFGKDLDKLNFDKIGLASHRDRFLKLLDAIASQPDKAVMLTEAYQALFPDDDKNSGGKVSALMQSLRGHTP